MKHVDSNVFVEKAIEALASERVSRGGERVRTAATDIGSLQFQRLHDALSRRAAQLGTALKQIPFSPDVGNMESNQRIESFPEVRRQTSVSDLRGREMTNSVSRPWIECQVDKITEDFKREEEPWVSAVQRVSQLLSLSTRGTKARSRAALPFLSHALPG